LLLIALVSLSLSAQTITVSPASGPPGIGTTVHGSGFPPNTAIRVSFDKTMALAPVMSDGSGAFKKSIRVPPSAQPSNHRVAAGVSGLGALAATKFLVRTNWPQFGFVASGGRFNPYENTLSVSTAPMLTELWSFGTYSSGTNYPSPAVANGVVYLGFYDGYLYALNARTGAILWSFIAEGGDWSPPAVANGVVYAQSYGTLYALTASTGALLWSFEGVSGPAVANGVVYVVSGNHLYALDATTGAQVWSCDLAGPLSGPSVANGLVYVGSNNSVSVVNASTGEWLWTFATEEAIRSMPTVVNGVVYVGADYVFYALNASTGALLWRFTPPGPWVDTSLPAVANGVVYVGRYDHNVYALNANTGALKWIFTAGDSVPYPPAVANGVVYVGSYDHNVYALDAGTGAMLWSFAAGRLPGEGSPPVVADGVVYVGLDDGKIHAFGLPRASVSQEDGAAEEH
jgi:outer membrane protein assembly factor BamB